MTLWTVTANRLLDGSVAYLSPDRRWTADLQGAWVANDEAAAQPMLEWALGEEHVICDPYLLVLDREEERITPCSARERIRAEGALVTLERLGYAALAQPQRAEPQRKAG